MGLVKREKGTDTSKGRKGEEKENPVARLKLLLVSVPFFFF